MSERAVDPYPPKPNPVSVQPQVIYVPVPPPPEKSTQTWKLGISGLVIAVVAFIWLIIFFSLYVKDPKFNSITVNKESKMDAVRYKRPVITLDIQNSGVSNPQTYNVSKDDTGAVFTVSSPNVDSQAYIYNIVLPTATGSGIYYTFVFDRNIIGDSNNNARLNIYASSGNMVGTIEISALPGSPLQGAGEVFPAPDTASRITFDNSKPINSSDSTSGIRKGTDLYFLDIQNNLWYVTGAIVVDSQVQTANQVVTPFV